MELCEKENKKRERLEERVKALDARIEIERREATELEEAHKRVILDVNDLATLLHGETEARQKFETKMEQSIELLKRNALARTNSTSAPSSPMSSSLNSVPVRNKADSTAQSASSPSCKVPSDKSIEMDQSV